MDGGRRPGNIRAGARGGRPCCQTPQTLEKLVAPKCSTSPPKTRGDKGSFFGKEGLDNQLILKADRAQSPKNEPKTYKSFTLSEIALGFGPEVHKFRDENPRPQKPFRAGLVDLSRTSRGVTRRQARLCLAGCGHFGSPAAAGGRDARGVIQSGSKLPQSKCGGHRPPLKLAGRGFDCAPEAA